MPRRTIAEARRTFEQDVLPSVSDYWSAQFKAELTAAEAKAQALADEHVSREADALLSVRDQALRELTDVRDSYEALTAQGRDARISAADYSNQLNVLRRRQTNAEEALARAESEAERLAEIEESPTDWFDNLTSRTHQLLEFSF